MATAFVILAVLALAFTCQAVSGYRLLRRHKQTWKSKWATPTKITLRNKVTAWTAIAICLWTVALALNPF